MHTVSAICPWATVLVYNSRYASGTMTVRMSLRQGTGWGDSLRDLTIRLERCLPKDTSVQLVTLSRGITYRRGEAELVAYSDSDYAGDPDVASQDLAGALIHRREGRTVHGHT